jgi:IS5 family transposase
MNRCWLKGALGDALHCISCAAGYNVRWLMRAIVAKGIKPFCWLYLAQVLAALQALLCSCKRVCVFNSAVSLPCYD